MFSWDTIGLWAGMIMPLWDIPLIIRILRRKSSSDISLVWMWGIWICSVGMTPIAFIGHNTVAIGFNVVNVTMLSALLIVVLKYRQRKEQ